MVGIARAVVVYQAGIANVFQVRYFTQWHGDRAARRLLQGSFQECIWFARGLKVAGVDVRQAACNEAGDVAERRWSTPLDEAPWSEKFATDFFPMALDR